MRTPDLMAHLRARASHLVSLDEATLRRMIAARHGPDGDAAAAALALSQKIEARAGAAR
jgi:nanoRNase/pAp phosphatase (c-di-AMP/oligoRNAs hydrolase)